MRPGHVTRFRNGLISKRFVHNRTHAAQPFGQQVPRLLCASDQNPKIFNPTRFFKLLHHRFSHEFFRLQIDMKTEIFYPLRRGWSDSRNFRRANLARVIVKFEKHLEKGIDTVRAGENDPVIRMRVLHQFGEFAKRSEEHTSELQLPYDLVCRLLLEKKKTASFTPAPASARACTASRPSRTGCAASSRQVRASIAASTIRATPTSADGSLVVISRCWD